MSSTVLTLLLAIPVVFLGVLLVGLLVSAGAARGRTSVHMPPQVGLAPDAETRVRELIAGRKKIEAIRVVREQTRLGLREAKELVEAMEAGHPLPAGPVAGDGAGGHGTLPGALGSVPAPTRARAEELIAQGAMIQAIKVVRQHTGFGLKEAKDYCDALRAGRLPSAEPLSDRARALIWAGDRAAAIALVCAETGMTESEAEAFLDALD
jgi:ribosomal protein L7/L12